MVTQSDAEVITDETLRVTFYDLGDVAGQLDDMELQDEGMEDAGAVAPPHDDAITVFSTHNGKEITYLSYK